MAGLGQSSPNNLPHQVTSFIGREREIVNIKRLLAGTRLVTLTGAGGCGKTRLAQEVGVGLLDRFSDGVWWVEMAALAEPGLVPQAVAAALGVNEQPGRPLIETLEHYLHLKSVLLLLDNCEHLFSACANLADTLLRSCPSLRVLATSRVALGLTGETKWRVPSLSLPQRHPVPSVKHLMKYEAVRLFCERARAAEPTFTLSDQNASAVVEVCIRLDGIPLAIELAAVRVEVLALDQIASRLDDRFRLLVGGSQGVLPRRRTLRATIDWSYGLLSETERTLLRRLSVFAGGWTLEAAEAICGGDGIETPDVLDVLTRLVEQSLVVAQARGTEARYRLLETVRQYSLDRLLELGEAADMRRRHLDWCVDLAERAFPELWESRWRSREATLHRLQTEHDNLRAALGWSLEENAEAGLGLGGALGPFWSASSHYGEGRVWLTKVLEKTKGITSPARARALRYAGFLAWVQGEYHEAVVLGEEGLTLARQMEHKEYIAGLLYVLGVAYRDVGNFERAARLLEEGRDLFQELGDAQHVADMVRHRGRLAANQGDYPLASTLFEQALDLYRETRSVDGIAYTLLNLGVVKRYQRDYTRALDLLEKSLTLFRELRATEGRAHALNGLARVLRLVGHHERALSLYEESLALSRDLGVKLAIQGCLYGMASVSALQGLSERAARLFAAAEVLRESINYALPVPDRTEYDGTVTAVRSTMGNATFAAAWAEGQAMTLEQAVEYALSSKGAGVRKARKAEDIEVGKRPGPLAPREREVAALVAGGLTNQEIASVLVIAERTAETHVQHILNKLGFNSRAQIAAWAVENGLHTASPR